jgi:hypothetical protein
MTCDVCRLRLIWDAGSVIIALKTPGEYLFESRVVCADNNAFPGADSPSTKANARLLEDCPAIQHL